MNAERRARWSAALAEQEALSTTALQRLPERVRVPRRIRSLISRTDDIRMFRLCELKELCILCGLTESEANELGRWQMTALIIGVASSRQGGIALALQKYAREPPPMWPPLVRRVTPEPTIHKQRKKLDKESTDPSCVCVVCMVNEPCMVAVPCGHLNFCMGCSEKLSKCPMCRKMARFKTWEASMVKVYR